MDDGGIIVGTCYCGGVKFGVTIDSTKYVRALYCHCESCRRAHAAPLYQVRGPIQWKSPSTSFCRLFTFQKSSSRWLQVPICSGTMLARPRRSCESSAACVGRVCSTGFHTSRTWWDSSPRCSPKLYSTHRRPYSAPPSTIFRTRPFSIWPSGMTAFPEPNLDFFAPFCFVT